MAWPASQKTKQEILELISVEMRRIEILAVSISNDSATRSINRRRIISFKEQIDKLDSFLADAESLGADMVSYIREQYGDPLMPVAADMAAVRTAAQGVSAWVASAFPDNTPITQSVNDVLVEMQATTAQTSGLRTAIASLTTAID